MHKSSSKEEFSARIKNWTDIAQSIFTVAAIIAGLIWFFMQRSDKPQIKLEHSVSQRVLAGEDGTLLIAVDIRVTNIGKVKVTLDKGVLQIYQVNPIPGEELVREDLKALVLEPGESDQALFKTYQLPDYIKTIQLRSNYSVPGSKRLSWNLLSGVDVGPNTQSKDSASSTEATTKAK